MPAIPDSHILTALIPLTIVTTTPLDIVLQHTPAVTARSGGTEQRSKENTLQPLPVIPSGGQPLPIQQPIHSLPWTKPKQKATPNATTNCSQDCSVQTQSSPIDTSNTVPQQQPNTKVSRSLPIYLGQNHPWSWLSTLHCAHRFPKQNTARGPSTNQHHYSAAPIQNQEPQWQYTVDTQVPDLSSAKPNQFIHCCQRYSSGLQF